MTRSRLSPVAVAAVGFLGLSGLTRAASISFGEAPMPGPNDVSQLAGAASEAANIAGGNDDATYIADDRPAQGQTFTTGAAPLGYRITSVSIQNPAYSHFLISAGLQTYNVRVTQLAGSTLTVLASETAAATGSEPGNLGDGPGAFGEGGGTGRFVTFTFDTPVVLLPNTQYGFDVGGFGDGPGPGRLYWDSNGTGTDAYPGGTAYSTGDNGIGTTGAIVRAGDRVFVAALTPVPEPVGAGPLGLAAVGLLCRRRRRV